LRFSRLAEEIAQSEHISVENYLTPGLANADAQRVVMPEGAKRDDRSPDHHFARLQTRFFAADA
jgi:hypothetical protein